MKYFYYTRWYLPGDDILPEGLYHTVTKSNLPLKEFWSTLAPNQDFVLKQFDTGEEMRDWCKENAPELA